jgi:hypothetical protein
MKGLAQNRDQESASLNAQPLNFDGSKSAKLERKSNQQVVVRSIITAIAVKKRFKFERSNASDSSLSTPRNLPAIPRSEFRNPHFLPPALRTPHFPTPGKAAIVAVRLRTRRDWQLSVAQRHIAGRMAELADAQDLKYESGFSRTAAKSLRIQSFT